MEERIIDDEYGRGIRLKKTKDGYVDVTDELAEEAETETEAVETDEESGEVVFEFPELDEDDEELATLTPEQAMELKKKREEERQRALAEYESKLSEGNALLETNEYEKAAIAFAAAMKLTDEKSAAAFGYWTAKTERFQFPDALADEYAQFGEDAYEEFVYDAGEDAAKTLKEAYHGAIERRLNELKAEKEPIESVVVNRQSERRAVLDIRMKKANGFFIGTLVPALVFLIATIVCATQINTRPDKLFVWITLGGLAAFVCTFAVFLVAAKKRINTVWIIRMNEDLTSTEDGARLVEIRTLESFYQNMVA